MKATTTLLFVFVFIISTFSFATEVEPSTAQKVAENFLSQQEKGVHHNLALVYTLEQAIYIFGDDHSFVIVSANDVVNPILGYSTESAFVEPQNSDYAVNFFGLINAYKKEIDSLVSVGFQPLKATVDEWTILKNGSSNTTKSGASSTAVTPLMTTTWGQGWPYNAYCPDASGGPGGRVWAGCVATALAQILHYTYSDESDFQGVGSYTYTWQTYPETSADFGNTSYDMASMPDAISTGTEPGASEIATLTYHAAVGCRAMWGAGSTGVMFSTSGLSLLGEYPMLAALQNYLPMAASAQWVIKSDYTDTEWDDLLQNELQNDRVVYYRGEGSLGHAWVCDGVDASELYHMNWGWDGSYNGYFALSAINPVGQNLNNNQMAMIGLQANDGSTLTSNTTWSTNMTVDNINVPDAVTLTIDAGITVSFTEGASMRVWGRVLSNGNADNYVKLTAVNQTDGWLGIDYHNDYLGRMADNDSSKFVFTQIEYSKKMDFMFVILVKFL